MRPLHPKQVEAREFIKYAPAHPRALRIVFIYRPKCSYNQRIVHLTPIMNVIFIGFFSRKRSKSKTRKIGIII